MGHRYYQYIKLNGEEFFTVVMLPERDGRFPVVIFRSPYVKNTVDMTEDEITQQYYKDFSAWIDSGYAVLYQHCRGQGKSTGGFVPYIFEREDGLAFREWVRTQPFYNGEIFLMGASYSASLHFATAPFEKDIKAAVFEVQDSERYRLWYRNGQMRKGHANWHFGLYKANCGLNKKHNMKSFSELPLKGLSERVLGERAEDFEQMLEASSPLHEFWRSHLGGIDTKDAVSNADIPILLTTGYNDFYTGGVFDMWNRMSEQTKAKSALLVSPYNHGDGYDKNNGVAFPLGQRKQAFGDYYKRAWFDNARKGTPIPYKKGVVTYYRVFEDKWQEDFYGTPTKELTIPMGARTLSFEYDPKEPPSFRGEGVLAEDFEGRKDVVSVYTPPCDKDIFVKGRMKVKLAVESNCEDTSFYLRISIKKRDYTYVLRHDITSLCYQLGDYKVGRVVTLDFCLDEYAFLIKKGECLRIDISSVDDNGYVCHTNQKGEYYSQTETTKAENKIHLGKSCLILPVEEL